MLTRGGQERSGRILMRRRGVEGVGVLVIKGLWGDIPW
jgi:hypothetical protein